VSRLGPTAVIDVGTNTVRLLVAERKDGQARILEEFGEVTSLGTGLVRTGRIEPADAERTADCLAEAVKRARAAGVEHPDVVGTEVFRRAANGRATADRLGERCGESLRILSPTEEADASYLGAVAWEEPPMSGELAVLDIGGGSTELIRGRGLERLGSTSLPVGALVATERWLAADPPGSGTLPAVRSALRAELAPLAKVSGTHAAGDVTLLAVGGSACSVAAWVGGIRPYLARAVHHRTIDRGQLAEAIGEMAELTVARRAEKAGIGLGRARVILGGALVLEAALLVLGAPAVVASTFGLRHGLIRRAWQPDL
jgi:exopolyphosphatase/guanosine-5'-triphosphate,3'-diphosphate pyrophosphatase